MTTPDFENATSGNTPSLVTIDRIVDAASPSGIGLTADATGRAAHGTHEELELMVVLLDSVFIVRGDSVTDTAADSPDATYYLAANEVNSTLIGAHAIVGNRTENIVIRTEAEQSVAAGMTDEQLRSAVSGAVNAVVSAHNAMVALSERITEAQTAVAEENEANKES